MVYTTAAIEVTTKLTIDYGGKDSMSIKLIIFSSLLIVSKLIVDSGGRK